VGPALLEVAPPKILRRFTPQNDSFKASPLARRRGLFVPVKQERILGRPSYYLEGLPVGVLLECVGYSQDHRIVEVFAYYHQTNG